MNRGRPDRLRGVNLLELVPVRNAPWTERDGRVVIRRPRPDGHGLRRLGRAASRWLGPARLRLDSLGSFTWTRLDGTATVGEVCDLVRDQFGDTAEPVEARVGEFVRLLHGERLVSYPAMEG